MNWTTASMTPRGKFNIITDINKYRFLVQGGSPSTKVNWN